MADAEGEPDGRDYVLRSWPSKDPDDYAGRSGGVPHDPPILPYTHGERAFWGLAMLALVVEFYVGGLWLKLAALVVMALLSGAVHLHRRRRIQALRG